MIKTFPRILLAASFIFCCGSVTDGKTWEESQSRHFKIYFTGEDLPFSETVLKKAEIYYSRLCDEWQFRPRWFLLYKKRYTIYLFENREDYLAATGRPPWSRATAAYESKTISAYRDSETFLESDLPHELAHLFFREVLGVADHSIPLWMDEGVALTAEQGKHPEFSKMIKKALRSGKEIPLNRLNEIQDLSKFSKETLGVFYAEAWSLTDFLIQHFGYLKFIQLCKSLAVGNSFEASLSLSYAGYFPGLDELEARWRLASASRPALS